MCGQLIVFNEKEDGWLGGGGLVIDLSLTKFGIRGNSSIALLRETHNLMGLRSWGQKAFNHWRQALGKLAEAKIQLITLVWYLYYDPKLYFTLQ